MGRHRKVTCLVCGKCMRSDKVKAHSLTHKDLTSLTEEEIKKELKVRHAQRLERESQAEKLRLIKKIALQEEVSIPPEVVTVEEGLSIAGENEKPLDDETLRKDILERKQKFHAKIEFGGRIARIIDEENADEQCLNPEQKDALRLFRKQQPQFEIMDVELRPWQQDAMKYFESPTQRQVIWIQGDRGNEGKTWFQNYVQSFLGYHRVCRLDLHIKHANICNVLQKRNLGTIDIFLFNNSRSVSGNELNLYRILEDIKDGQATTAKYNNDNIRFKTPNTVMIFSNHYPNLSKLSKDRWIVLNPNSDGLKDILGTKKCNEENHRSGLWTQEWNGEKWEWNNDFI